MNIQFFIPHNPDPVVFKYFHAIVVLAEGFQKLGIEFFGTCDYWYDPVAGEYLIKKAPNGYQSEVDIYVKKCFENGETKINPSKINVLMDTGDGMFTCSSDKRFFNFDLIFLFSFY